MPGGTYFFTCVTYCRCPILTTNLGRKCLGEAIRKVRKDHLFETVAIVLLPEHWHTVWTRPPHNAGYPLRWMRIKEEFTEAWLRAGGDELPQSVSRKKHRQRGVWHKRYWEHTVSNEDDLKRCVDYIHWNACKHNLAERVRDWKWSSFHRYVQAGEYDPDWGGTNPVPDWDDPESGDVQ